MTSPREDARRSHGRPRAFLTMAALAVASAVAGCRGSFPPGWAYVSRVTATAATLVWTGPAGEHAVCRGSDGAIPDGRATSPETGLQVVRLEGLAPSTRYVCRLGRAAGTVRFRTAPAGNEPFRFAVVGDTGDKSPEAAALARRILAGRPDFLLHLGDMAYPASKVKLLGRRFFEPYRRVLARVPLYPTPGNHDLASRRGAYRDLFASIADGGRDHPRYAFDWGAAHFVSVASPGIATAADDTLDWLARDLAHAATRPWRIAFLHQAPFTAGHKTTSGLRARLQPVVETGRVALLLAGHSHLYERAAPACASDPTARVLPIVSGGGGANLDPLPGANPKFTRVVRATHYLRVRISADTIDVRAVDVSGRVLDRIRIRRDAPTPCRAEDWPRGRG